MGISASVCGASFHVAVREKTQGDFGNKGICLTTALLSGAHLKLACSLTLCCPLLAVLQNCTDVPLLPSRVRACHNDPFDKCLLPIGSDLKLRVRILIDGTLIIFRVKPEDAGKYTCSPSNSLGVSPSASAHLTVQCECYRGNVAAGRGAGSGERGEGR